MASRRGPTLPADEEAVQHLQAIVLADTFAQKFKPITLEKPKVLMPLASVPMLDYTLEWLASSGVDESFVFACAHSNQIKEHIDTHWKNPLGFSVKVVVALDCVSVGDALRHMDQKGVIVGDFVLVSGDTVANLSIAEPLKIHRERRKKDKQAVMTMMVQKTAPHPITRQTRLGSDEIIFGVDPSTRQLLFLDLSSDWSVAGAKSIVLEKNIFEEASNVQLHSNWEDCQVSICGPEVLMLFTDNFDYQSLKSDLVRGLINDDIMGNKIHVYELPESAYASRVECLRSYAAVTLDVLERWTFPLVPDRSFGSHGSSMKLVRDKQGLVYRGEGVYLARTADISGTVFLGDGTVVDEQSRICSSVIGRNCVIGRNVVLSHCCLWDNVKVGDGARLQGTIACDGAVVGRDVAVPHGCVLGFQVVLGAGASVAPFSRFSKSPRPTEDAGSDDDLEASADGEEEEAPRPVWDHKEVGTGGAGVLWSSPEGDSDWRYSFAAPSAEKLAELAASEAAELANVRAGEDLDREDLEEEESDEEEEDGFESEVRDLFQRTVDEGAHFDNIVLEINALKLGMVKSFADCAGAILRGMLTLVLQRAREEADPPSHKSILTTSRAVVKKWGPLLRRFLKQQDDEIEVILTFEDECSQKRLSAFAPLFSKVLEILYDEDVASEEAIVAWASEKAGAEDSEKVFLKQSQAFIKWLQEADEEESQEEGEEEAAGSSEQEDKPAAAAGPAAGKGAEEGSAAEEKGRGEPRELKAAGSPAKVAGSSAQDEENLLDDLQREMSEKKASRGEVEAMAGRQEGELGEGDADSGSLPPVSLDFDK